MTDLWQPMDTAPRDGSEITIRVRFQNGFFCDRVRWPTNQPDPNRRQWCSVGEVEGRRIRFSYVENWADIVGWRPI